MLEQALDQLTQAVRELVAVLQVGQTTPPARVAAPPALPTRAVAPPAPPAPEAPEPEAPPMRVEIRTLTAADVRAAVVECSRTHGNDAARAILKAAGVAKLPDLPEDKFMEVYKACKRLNP